MHTMWTDPMTWLPPGVEPLPFLVLAGLSALIFGAGKAGFGGGVGLISTPLMIYAYNGQSASALAVMLPLLIVCDYISLFAWWRQWEPRNIRLLLPGAIVGIAAAGGLIWFFMHLGGGYKGLQHAATNAGLGLMIGLIALIFVGLRFFQVWRGQVQAFRPVLWQGSAMGATAGLTSTLAHGAGPVVTMFLLPQQMPKGQFVATTVLFFWIVNQLKLVPYTALGLFSFETFRVVLILLPAVAVGAAAGLFLHSRISQTWFTRAIYAVLTVIALDLVYRSGSYFLG